MKKNLVKIITRNAIVAALYAVITVAGAGLAYEAVQVRIAEALILLCFFNRDYTYGLTIGCLIANLFSPLLPWDLIIGTAATLISCILISYCKHLLIATLIPVIANGIFVGLELHFILDIPFWSNAGFVALGEVIAITIFGYAVFMLLRKNEKFMNLIDAKRNTNFAW